MQIFFRNLGQFNQQMFYRFLLFGYFCLNFLEKTIAQTDNTFIVISEIKLDGNKKTKFNIILRELDIAVGDTIYNDKIEATLQRNRNKIVNIDLFLHVDLSILKLEPPHANLIINLIEQNFYYPFPAFRLADRSFNEWWYNRHHDFKRVIYGLNFIHFNIGGRAEELWVNLENGFAKRVSILYKIPYVNKTMKTGLDFDFKYDTNKKMPYRTENDKLVYESSENVLLKRLSGRVVLRRRNNFYERQRLELSAYHQTLADTMAILNPNYFLVGKTKLNFYKMMYEFEGDHRDNYIYPSKGHYFIGKFTTIGLFGGDKYRQNELYLSYLYYERLGGKWFGDFNVRTKITSPHLQSWATSSAFGYSNENVRGFDLNVIDGQKFGLFKVNIRREFLNTTVKVPNWGVWKKANKQPFALYGKLFFDAGYVSNVNYKLNNSTYSNTLLKGYGFGIDIVSIYTGAIKASYAYNNFGGKGLFFSYGRDF